MKYLQSAMPTQKMIHCACPCARFIPRSLTKKLSLGCLVRATLVRSKTYNVLGLFIRFKGRLASMATRWVACIIVKPRPYLHPNLPLLPVTYFNLPTIYPVTIAVMSKFITKYIKTYIGTSNIPLVTIKLLIKAAMDSYLKDTLIIHCSCSYFSKAFTIHHEKYALQPLTVCVMIALICITCSQMN